MRPIAYVVAIFVGVLLSCHVIAQGANDVKNIQGAWDITELIVAGKKMPASEVKGMRFVFSKNTLTIVPPVSDNGVVDKRVFSFVLDTKATPASVDLTALDGENKGKISPGIYELKGDTLRWCQSDDPESKVRPKDFNSPPKSSYYLFTFKRAK